MTVTSRTLTLEEFLVLPEEEPALEYVDGVVTQKMSPKTRHSVLQFELASRINAVAVPAKLARAFPELRETYAGESKVPDISVFRWDRIPRDEDGVYADDVFQPPDIAIEIVSPGQSVNALMRRCLRFVEHGVSIALLVDPDDRSIVAFRPEQKPVTWHGGDRIDLDEVLPDFALTTAELFAALQAG